MSEEYTEQESGEELIGEDSSDELLEEYGDEDEEIVEEAISEGVDIDDEEEFGDWLAENYGELDEEDEEEGDEEDDEEEGDEEEDPEGDPEDEDELGEKMSGAQRRKAARAQYKKDKKDPAKMKRRAKLAKISAKKRKNKKVKKRGALKAEFDHDIDEDFDDLDEKKMSAAAKKKKKAWLKTPAGKKSLKKAKLRAKKIRSGAIKVNKALSAKMKKARKKGGISGSYQVPGTKNQMLKNIYDEVNGMLKSDLAAKYEQIMGATSLEEIEEEVTEPVRTPAVSPEEISPPNVQDDVEALVAGEEGLSDEFKQKASTIFEAAVHAKVVDEVNSRIEDHQKESEASKEEYQKELTEKVDGYLTYVVEEWMKENELAIERGIRAELVEDFMSGLKTLFTEHYIDLPEEKVDMVDDLFTKVEELETSLDEEINRGVELQKELAQFKKDDAVKQTTKDLADSDSEKIAKLAEGIEFENSEQYIEKLNVLKESYFPKTKAVTSEITETDENIEVSEEETQKLNESMKHYTSAIRRYNS